MVSRFPNGSPVEYSAEAQTVATFNREFTRDELIGKLSCVNFRDGWGVSTCVTDSTQPEDESIVKMSASGQNDVYLQIEGNSLKVYHESNAGYLFDIDFDGQHRKFFEQVSANYLIQFPDLVGQGAIGTRYAIAQVVNSLESNGALTVNLAVNNTADYYPMAADTELTDIDVASWFNNGSGSSMFARITDLMKEIMKMEYDIPSGVTFNISSTTSAEWAVDGGLWNLFTDGSEYTPLVMTSRFPNGSPITLETAPKMLASFNRPTKFYELKDKLDVAINEVSGVNVVAWSYNDGQIKGYLNGPGYSLFEIIPTGSNLFIKKANGTGYEFPKIYDFDFDQQHQRPLNLPSSETPLMFECANPDILGVGGDKLDLFMFNNLGNLSILVVTDAGGTEVMGSNGLLPPRDYQETPSEVVSVINAILEMEFSNYDDFTTDTEIYSDEPISGTVDLLTVSTVTPA